MNHAQRTFANTYSTHIDEIYRYVFFRLHQHQQTAEDVTNDIFIKAWKHSARYDARKASVRTFLFRIARTVVIDYYKTHQHEVHELSEEIVSPERTDSNTDAQLFWESAAQILEPHAYDMLILKYRHEWTSLEIAEVFDTTEDAVKSQLKRSRSALETSFNDTSPL